MKKKSSNETIKKENEQKSTFPFKSTIGLFKSSLMVYICGCIISTFLVIYFFSFKGSVVDGVRYTFCTFS